MYRLSIRLQFTASTPFLAQSRHTWVPEEDDRLRKLVSVHSTRWTTISQKMKLGMSPMSYRRRWECIESNSSGAWTMVEDKRLQRAVEQMKQLGMTPGQMYGFWVHVSKNVGGGRSSRDCHLRWATHFKPLTKSFSWQPDEIQRLDAAVELLSTVSDCAQERNKAENCEPWLLICTDTRLQPTLPTGFWADVAMSVGTRCMHQCRKRWEMQQQALRLENKLCGGCRMGNQMKPSDVCRLADLAEKLKTPLRYMSWIYIRNNYFPDMEPYTLKAIHRSWKSMQRQFETDLKTIKPESMLHDYTIVTKTDLMPESTPKGPAITAWAMRPTGHDGKYDPQGILQKVEWHRQVTPLTPFYLALARVKPSATGRETAKWPHRPKIVSTYLADRLSAPGDKTGRLQRHSNEFIDKLVQSVMQHKDDMRAIAKDVGLPPYRCRPLVQELMLMLPRLADTQTHKTG